MSSDNPHLTGSCRSRQRNLRKHLVELFSVVAGSGAEPTKISVLGKGAVANKHGSRSYFTQKDTSGFLPGAVYFVNDRTYVYTFTIEAMKGLLTKLDVHTDCGLASRHDYRC